MAKKKRAKELREEAKRAKMEERKRLEEKRQEEKMIEAIEPMKVIEDEEKEESLRKKTKSKAKAAGVKSVIDLGDDKILITSFGKGNEAIRDKYIENELISNIGGDRANLEVSIEGEKKFSVSGRKIQGAVVDNPLGAKENPRDDLIHCRKKLERMYFGKEFKDNIHIQLIYNILDIEKILAVQVNNIVYSLNNLLRRNNEEHDDFIGYMGFRYTYKEFRERDKERYKLFQNLIYKAQMGYFGTIFLAVDEDGDWLERGENGYPERDSSAEEFEQKCYHLFAILGTVRQATAHGSEGNRSSIYRMGNDNKSICKQAAYEELDELYRDEVHKLNEGFLKKSSKDITIFSEAYELNDVQLQYVVQEYYKFVVLKTFKNMGFSIKRLRETMIATEAQELSLDNKKYDTVRKKLYRAIDFSIYLYYKQEEKQEEATELIEKLRASSEESEKELIYRDTAKKLWKELGTVIGEKICCRMNGKYIKEIESEPLDNELIKDVLVSETADSFSKMVYLLTIFLDGKEINDLLTQLINRFDNISSFLDVMKQENIEVPFKNAYKMFLRSAEISKELRVINSFARMSKPAPTAKKAMFIEAAQVLGYEEKEGDLERYIGTLLNPEEKGSGKNKNGFRNFIINNVIESSRFKYLVRYGNPKKIRALATNKKVVSFVLREIPDDQIKRYYNNCEQGVVKDCDKMREKLCERITKLHFTEFKDVYQANTADKEKIKQKELKKNSIRLYLTVLYLLQKNLIYVNSRYFLAFHCAERDAMTYDKKKYTEAVLKEDRMLFAKEFIEVHGKNKRACSYLQQNMENADRWSLRAFRNCTEHLNAVRNADKYIRDIANFNSYFELYHYLVQRSLIDQFKYDCNTLSRKNDGTTIYSKEQAEGKLLQYFELVEKYHSYCKDFVKALCTPFAYNLPRYKNLSINELYDRNNYLPNKGKEMDTKEIWE